MLQEMYHIIIAHGKGVLSIIVNNYYYYYNYIFYANPRLVYTARLPKTMRQIY